MSHTHSCSEALTVVSEKLDAATVQPLRSREWILSNQLGGYASGTLQGIPTRRYHGLLIASEPNTAVRSMLLHSLYEEWSYCGQTRSTSAYQFTDGTVHPQGYTHLIGCKVYPHKVTWRYAWDDLIIERTISLGYKSPSCYIHYRVLGASEPIRFQLRPLVAFRDHHHLQHGDRQYSTTLPSSRLAAIQANDRTSRMFLQTSTGSVEPLQIWFWNFYYQQEKDRGLDSIEDLFVPVVIQGELTHGSELTISASLDKKELSRRSSHLSAQEAHCLSFSEHFPETTPRWLSRLAQHSAVFPVYDGQAPEPESVIAGFPWFSSWTRDTLLSLPGLFLATGKYSSAKHVLLTAAAQQFEGLLPVRIAEKSDTTDYCSADSSLLLAYAVWQYTQTSGDSSVLKKLVPALLATFTRYRDGITLTTERGTATIGIDPNDYLVFAQSATIPLTWMDAVVDGRAATPRNGKAIELQGLWYTLLCVLLDAPRSKALTAEMASLIEHKAGIEKSIEQYWAADRSYLADTIGNSIDTTLRPNQLLICGLPFSPISLTEQRRVLDTIRRELITPLGPRTVSASDSRYRGNYSGDQFQRDSAYHQGAIWPWLLEFYCRAASKQGDSSAAAMLGNFEAHLQEVGIGFISELCNGDSPYSAQGCPAQAWSCAALLWIFRSQFQQSPIPGVTSGKAKGATTKSASKSATPLSTPSNTKQALAAPAKRKRTSG